MQVNSIKQLSETIAVNTPVAVKLKTGKDEWGNDYLNDEYKELEDSTLVGWWLGVEPNEDVSPVIRDSDNAWHWVGHLADAYSDDKVYVIHLALIDTIDIASVVDVRE